MDSLGVAFRHADEVETELSLKDGGTIKGSELRLTGTIGLQSLRWTIESHRGSPGTTEMAARKDQGKAL